MKLLMFGLAVSLGGFAGNAKAEVTLNIDGKDYPLSVVMENCQKMSDEPAAQIACFADVSKLLEEQSSEAQKDVESVPDALGALRAVAGYKTDETGLVISGTDCNIQILYYDNYFHISRRNVSSIDLFSAEFDATNLQYNPVAEISGAAAPLSRGSMVDGATAATRGGVAIESSQYDFAPKSARTTIGDYAKEVADQLAANESQEFDFVLVHPKKRKSSAEIWNAFGSFLDACKA